MCLVLIMCFEITPTIPTSSTQKVSNMFKKLSQSKRDLSLSYAATNIDSKEGTRVKTITVIKNLGNGKEHEKLSINPELHKNENWAEAFRDNFDSYGIIPDVPDIDDLFEFVNKKKANGNGNQNHNHNQQKSKSNTNSNRSKNDEKPVKEPNEETKEEKIHNNSNNNISSALSGHNKSKNNVEKIEGDAELLQNNGTRNSQNRKRSQSLSMDNTKQRLIDINYSTPQHSVHQYFQNYIQQQQQQDQNSNNNQGGYDYNKPPCNAVNPPNSINIATPSGRHYDTPVQGAVSQNPYLAPAVTKKPTPTPLPPIQQQPQQPQPIYPIQFPLINTIPNLTLVLNRTPFSVNSLVSPLNQQRPQQQPQQQQPQQQPQQVFQPVAVLPLQPIPLPLQTQTVTPTVNTPTSSVTPPPAPPAINQPIYSTSQRPYVAPNLRNGLSYGRGPAPPYMIALGRTRPNNYRPGFYGYGSGRSRGLKY